MNTNAQAQRAQAQSSDPADTAGAVRTEELQAQVDRLNRSIERANCLAGCLGNALDARDRGEGK